MFGIFGLVILNVDLYSVDVTENHVFKQTVSVLDSPCIMFVCDA